MRSSTRGFTIVELLIVIVVIAILAAITIVAYSGIQSRAYTSKVESDYRSLELAIRAARTNTSQTLREITGNSHTAGLCRANPLQDGVDLASLPTNHTCWVSYGNALNAISNASGIDVRGLVDPWGWPYAIDENEGEGGGCGRDTIYVFNRPLNTYAAGPHDALSVEHPDFRRVNVPRSGFSGCAAE